MATTAVSFERRKNPWDPTQPRNRRLNPRINDLFRAVDRAEAHSEQKPKTLAAAAGR